MAPRSKIKESPARMMKSTRSYFVLVIVACLPIYACASELLEPETAPDDLLAEESQHIGLPPQRIPLPPPSGLPRLAALPTSPIPVAVPAPPNAPLSSILPPPQGFSIPKTDLASAPSYSPRYVVPPVSPWDERLPFEVASFRRRAAQEEDDAPAEDDYQPSESKGKKSSPSVFKRIRNGIRNTGKAIVGAPSYIIKRYRKYFGGGGGGGGGGGKKKQKGWKGWSSSPKQDDTTGWGGGGWEEYDPSGFDGEPSRYPSEKGWKSGKGGYRDYDSHERRYDREPSGYRDYRDRDRDRARDDYRDDRDRSSPPPRERSRGRERPQKYSQSYREETHYDDYDGRRTTAYYGPDRKSPPERTSERPTERLERPPEKKRPYGSSTSASSNGSTYKYDDDY